MAIQTFVADTILTAAQMNALQGNDYNQTVSTKTASYTLVAADKGTKIVMNSASATTITVNTSLFSAGDTLTILNIGAGVTTVTAGTATVSSAGSLALSQYSSGTLYFTSAGVSVFEANGVTPASDGLVFIGRTTVAASSTVNINNVFTSTYTNYQIVTDLTTSANTAIQMRLRVSAADNTTSNYNIAYAYQQVVTAQSTGFIVSQGQSLFNLHGATGRAANMNMTIFNPQAADSTTMAFNNNDADSAANGWYVFNGGAAFTAATSFDGFSLLTGGVATFTGTIDIYGWAKA